MLLRIVTLLAIALAVVFAQQRFVFTKSMTRHRRPMERTPLVLPGRPNRRLLYRLRVCGHSTTGQTHGFMLDSSGRFTMIDDPLGSQGTSPGGINAAGQIVGSYYTAGGRAHGFLYDRGSFTTIEQPAATNTFLSGINAAGSSAPGPMQADTTVSYIIAARSRPLTTLRPQ